MNGLLVTLVLINLSAFAQVKKVKKLSPFQSAIRLCLDSEFPAAQLTDNKKLYFEITKRYTLQSSETTFREVDYNQDGERRKLRFEDGLVKIFKVDKDDNVVLLKTEDVLAGSKNSGMRYKVNSVEALLNQHLNRASIRSDFIKTLEFRSKQVTLELTWSNDQIKRMLVNPGAEKALFLDCQRSGNSDICECKPQSLK